MFTLLPLPRVEEILAEHEQSPEARLAQRLLASEVTELIHGGAYLPWYCYFTLMLTLLNMQRKRSRRLKL